MKIDLPSVLSAVPSALSDEGLGNVRGYLLQRLLAGDYLLPHECSGSKDCGVCAIGLDARLRWEAKLVDFDREVTERSSGLLDKMRARQRAKAINFGMPTSAQKRGTAIHEAIARTAFHEKGSGIPAPASDDDCVDAATYLLPLRKLGLLLALVLPLGCEATGPRPLDLPPPDAARDFDLARADRVQPGPDLLELVDLAEPAPPPDLAAPAVDLSNPPDFASPAPDLSAPPDLAPACYPSRSYCADPANVVCCVAGQLCVGVSTFPPQECRSFAGGWCASSLDCAPGRLTCSGGKCIAY